MHASVGVQCLPHLDKHQATMDMLNLAAMQGALSDASHCNVTCVACGCREQILELASQWLRSEAVLPPAEVATTLAAVAFLQDLDTTQVYH